jgi:ubiquinone/menaquinone biosynthesis C-methylase UbiE
VSEGRSRGFASVSVPEAYERYVRRQLFDPWARELLHKAGLRRGASVLDVACGPGTVAHMAAAQAGPDGRVLATDISAAMLAVASSRPAEPESAPVEYRECSASNMQTPDGAFDAVLCQQGVQFFPDRPAAVAEMNRSLKDGGVAVLSVWSADHPLGLFGPIAEVLAEVGVAEPYAGAFDPASYTLTALELEQTLHLDCTWDSPDEALATISGTPFGPLVSELPASQQQQLRARLLELLGRPSGEVSVRTSANIARAVKR